MIRHDGITDWLLIAKEAALRAGKFLLKSRQQIKKIDSEKRRDIKIRADRESERIILAYLKENSNFSIISEESGVLEGRDKSFTWIVDPLDGSLNFLRGIPIFCVSIGLWKDKKPILGVIYDFNKDELFSGIANKIAWLNGQKIKVSHTAKRGEAVFCTGFPVKTDFSTKGVLAFTRQVQIYKKIRLFGSAALSLAYVAAGRIDAYYENDIMIWDVAAGLAIVTGAGGNIQVRPAKKENAFVIYASNRYLSKRLDLKSRS